jgi:hypothetical protein
MENWEHKDAGDRVNFERLVEKKKLKIMRNHGWGGVILPRDFFFLLLVSNHFFTKTKTIKMLIRFFFLDGFVVLPK